MIEAVCFINILLNFMTNFTVTPTFSDFRLGLNAYGWAIVVQIAHGLCDLR